MGDQNEDFVHYSCFGEFWKGLLLIADRLDGSTYLSEGSLEFVGRLRLSQEVLRFAQYNAVNFLEGGVGFLTVANQRILPPYTLLKAAEKPLKLPTVDFVSLLIGLFYEPLLQILFK